MRQPNYQSRLFLSLFLFPFLLLFLGAGCSGSQTVRPSFPPPALNNAPEIESGGLIDSAVVSIGPRGFNPAQITVKKGQAVTWINEDPGGSHRPAVNPHPAHTDYPGFDALASIPPGGSWSFIFKRTGEWRYHDNLQPSFEGVVQVSE
ncbi:hypothetical protein EPN90_01080 [Patescibacteria group bacterium]|nr:MAG: hypothetical protein EPN90_01080 [Patescibacteria group bacterium]